MYYTNCVNILAAFLTPTVAIIAAYIAYKQHRIEKERLKLDLFEKRYAVFNASREFIIEVNTYCLFYPDDPNYKKSLHVIRNFSNKTQDTSFLFDSEMVEYVDLLRRKGSELIKLNALIDRDKTAPERGKKIEEDNDIVKWFLSEGNNVYKKFEKYMRIYYPDQSVLSKMKQRAALICKKIEEVNRNVSGSE